VISGNHLTDSTNVRFGSTSASSFTIDSNTQITALGTPGRAAVDWALTAAEHET
jgi:hypothetical protein